MRQGQQNRRGRSNRGNGGGGRKPQNPITRNYESSGPDIKIRGTAMHIAEKYAALARDAMSSGDNVAAENYLQHAEHYNRIVMAAQAQMQPQAGEGGQPNGPNGFHANGGNGRAYPDFLYREVQSGGEGGDEGEGEDEPAYMNGGRYQTQPHYPQPQSQRRQPSAQSHAPAQPIETSDLGEAEQPRMQGPSGGAADQDRQRRRRRRPAPGFNGRERGIGSEGERSGDDDGEAMA
jgi:hypothetical protein